MRTFVKYLIAAALLYANTAIAAPPQASIPNPIKEVTPFASADELSVIGFFKFSCPICRNYHLPLEYWGKSLPPEFKYQFYPVIEGDATSAVSVDSARASMFFWAVERSGNRMQRAAFADNAYEVNLDFKTQDQMKSWADAVKKTEIQGSKFLSAWGEEEKVWADRAARQAHYKPTVTPTLVICGKWMISPDSTNGDQYLFMQLANGLVSKCMTEKGIQYRKR